MHTLSERISISLMRRKYGIPYGEAAQRLKLLEQCGAVSKPDKDGIRLVLTGAATLDKRHATPIKYAPMTPETEQKTRSEAFVQALIDQRTAALNTLAQANGEIAVLRADNKVLQEAVDRLTAQVTESITKRGKR